MITGKMLHNLSQQVGGSAESVVLSEIKVFLTFAEVLLTLANKYIQFD